MTLPTLDEFVDLLRNRPLLDVATNYVLGQDTFAFASRRKRNQLRTLMAHLSQQLNISSERITIVGSGKVGFSLDPEKFGRPFNRRSDIDFLVVDSAMFDQIWLNLIRWQYPRRQALPHSDREFAANRRRNVYWGWFEPDEIQIDDLSVPELLRPLRDVKVKWFNAFQSLSRYEELASRRYDGRLYRTWEHALAYQMDGLRQIKERHL